MFNSSETTPNVLNLAFYVLSGSAVMRTTTTADKNIGQRIFCTILSLLGNPKLGFLSLIGSACKLSLCHIESIPIYNGRVVVANEILSKLTVVLSCFL